MEAWFWKKKGTDSPENVPVPKALDQYEKCKKNPSIGRSGFHDFGEEALNPFVFCGYADTHSPWFGVAFRINRDCFDGRNAELYYMDDDYFGIQPHYLQQLRDRMETYSSGLTDIEIVTQYENTDFTFQGKHKHPQNVTTIRFRLDAAKIKESVSVDGGKTIPSTESGGYVLVIPKVGEFDIELGEIIDGKRIPLHYDGFFMK